MEPAKILTSKLRFLLYKIYWCNNRLPIIPNSLFCLTADRVSIPRLSRRGSERVNYPAVFIIPFISRWFDRHEKNGSVEIVSNDTNIEMNLLNARQTRNYFILFYFGNQIYSWNSKYSSGFGLIVLCKFKNFGYMFFFNFW